MGPGINQRELLLGSSGGSSLTGSTWRAARAQAEADGRRCPNIVLVIADDLGYRELGSFGQQHILTPTLDRLAAEGVRYTDMYAGAPVCGPSRCTLFTGLHTGHATVRNNPMPGEPDQPLLDDEITFAHLLKSVGYATALFGKWGFCLDKPGFHPSHPNPQGFDEFFGWLSHEAAHAYYPEVLFHNEERVEFPENRDDARATYGPDFVAERTLEFIEENAEQPFLVVLSTTIPHAPQHVPDLGPYTDLDWPEGDKAHASQITRLDSQVQQLVDRLTELGLVEDTVVMFISDNGPHEEDYDGHPLDPEFFDANGPLRGYKRNLYEGGIRTPAVIWAPGYMGDRAGTVVNQPLAFWDMMPTVADLAGAPVPEFIDGRSMRGTFDSSAEPSKQYPAADDNRALYFWRNEPFTTSRAEREERRDQADPSLRDARFAAEAVRRQNWKGLRFAPGKDRNIPDEDWMFELYDLDSDIGEQHNVTDQHPELSAELLALMKESWVEPPFDRGA